MSGYINKIGVTIIENWQYQIRLSQIELFVQYHVNQSTWGTCRDFAIDFIKQNGLTRIIVTPRLTMKHFELSPCSVIASKTNQYLGCASDFKKIQYQLVYNQIIQEAMLLDILYIDC